MIEPPLQMPYVQYRVTPNICCPPLSLSVSTLPSIRRPRPLSLATALRPWPPPPPSRRSSRSWFASLFVTSSTIRFVGAAGNNICRGGWYCSRSYKSIYRGGLGTPAPTNRFVGAATVPTAPTNHFSAKKNLNLQFKFDQNIYFSCTTPS